MKKLYLVGLTLAMALLVSCVPTSTTPAQTPQPTDNSSPVSSLPEPSPSLLKTPEPTVPADVSPTPKPTVPANVSPAPEPSASTLLTFDEARKICGTWLKDHDDVPSELFQVLANVSFETSPPTYFLFGMPYYEFQVSYDAASKSWHYILVQADTGELVSLNKMRTKNLTVIVELLDDWYVGEPATYAPASLTADEAIEIYDTWLSEHSDNPEFSAEYSLDKQSYDTYVLFGEQYYFFQAKDEQKYWYNILVHMETGELLFMMIEDGMYGGTTIEPLDDWYDTTYPQ
jgi:hypothetical protein